MQSLLEIGRGPRSRGAALTLRLLLIAAGLLTAGTLPAFHGVVETAGGERLEGEIRLQQEGFTVTNTNGASRRIELNEFAFLRADDPPKTETPPAAQRHGLRATYFNSRDLSGKGFRRIDPVIDFRWMYGSPMTGVGPDNFSARWEGQIKPRASGKLTFYTQSGAGTRLWINERNIIDHWQEGGGTDQTGSIELEAGKKYDLKMEIYKRTGNATARLLWAEPSKPRSVVPAERLYPPASEPPEESTGTADEGYGKAPGVQMTGGSFIARRVQIADGTLVKFSESPKESGLSILNVARIYFQPPTAETEARLPPRRSGVLLRNQDFIESEFNGILRGKVKISSVLFGLRNYDAGQVLAVSLRDPATKPAPAAYELRTRSGSRLMVNAFSVDHDLITIQDPALAGLQIPARDLTELRKSKISQTRLH